MIEGGSRIEIDALSKWGQTYLMGQVGYQSITKLEDRDRLNFIRYISSRGDYPRFHLHTTRSERRFNVDLHLDRKVHISTTTDEQIIIELERISDFFSHFANRINGTSPSYESFLRAFQDDLLFGVAERTSIPLRTIYKDRLTTDRNGMMRKVRSPRTNIPAPINPEEY